tara:strand:- start:131 stop:367 length:237 start_codon:yes stop_codon:yes gene_type:complete
MVFFADVVLNKVGASTVALGREKAHHLAAKGLNFYDFDAEFRQHFCAMGPGNYMGEVNDGKIIQYLCHPPCSCPVVNA